MTTTPAPAAAPTGLPAGRWTVDPADGTVGFRARGMFGLAGVKGTFDRYDGELSVDAAGAAAGELRLESASLDTGNAKRDAHLHGDDFFAVQEHPTVTFELTRVVGSADGPQLDGVLHIRENRMPLRAPLEVVAGDGDTLRLHTAVAVDRAEAGVGWSKLGMIQGDAKLDVTVTLRRVAA